MIERFLLKKTQEDRTYVGRDFYCCDGDFLRCGRSLRSRLRAAEIGDAHDAGRRHFAGYLHSFVRVLVLRAAEGGGVLTSDCEWMVPDFLLPAGDFPGDKTAGNLYDAGF